MRKVLFLALFSMFFAAACQKTTMETPASPEASEAAPSEEASPAAAPESPAGESSPAASPAGS